MNLPVSTVRDWFSGGLPHNTHPIDQANLCDVCGHELHRFEELPAAYVYLLGLYLGDGCLSAHRRNVYRLRITLDIKYPVIIATAAAAIDQVRPGKAHVQVRRDNCVEVSAFSKSWPCLFPQHGPGAKHKRRIALTEWQLQLVNRWPHQLLRGLIQSDGSRFLNTGRGNWCWPRYAFSNHSSDIRSIFSYACDQIGLHWTKAGKYRIYVSLKADVARLDTFIGPKR